MSDKDKAVEALVKKLLDAVFSKPNELHALGKEFDTLIREIIKPGPASETLDRLARALSIDSDDEPSPEFMDRCMGMIRDFREKAETMKPGVGERLAPFVEYLDRYDAKAIDWAADKTELEWLAKLQDEVDEARGVLEGTHDDSLVHELLQIATIAFHWAERLRLHLPADVDSYLEPSPPAPEVPKEPESGGCEDCNRPYGDEHGFPDMIIPDEQWKAISTTGTTAGLLCPSCILARLHAADQSNVGAHFASGPCQLTPTAEAERLSEVMVNMRADFESPPAPELPCWPEWMPGPFEIRQLMSRPFARIVASNGEIVMDGLNKKKAAETLAWLNAAHQAQKGK